LSEEKLLKAIVSIAEGFENLGSLAAELKAIVGEITETGTVEHLTDKTGCLLARIIESDIGETTVMPVHSLEIKVSDPAIQRFLIPRVLEKLREKHEINYEIEAHWDLLRAIKIKGLTQEQLEELKKPLAWTLEKASSREPTQTEKENQSKLGETKPEKQNQGI
jgi:hypothetical protein